MAPRSWFINPEWSGKAIKIPGQGISINLKKHFQAKGVHETAISKKIKRAS